MLNAPVSPVTGATRAGSGSGRVWASFGRVMVLLSGRLIKPTGMMSGFSGMAVMRPFAVTLAYLATPLAGAAFGLSGAHL